MQLISLSAVTCDHFLGKVLRKCRRQTINSLIKSVICSSIQPIQDLRGLVD